MQGENVKNGHSDERENYGNRGQGGDRLNKLYARWLAAAENVWMDLMTNRDRETMSLWRSRALEREGIEDNVVDNWSMRVNGARFVWVNAAGQPGTNAPSANKVTMTWTTVVRHLKGIAAVSNVRRGGSKAEREKWRHAWKCRRSLWYMALCKQDDIELRRIQSWLKEMIRSDDWAEQQVVGYVARAATEMHDAQAKLNTCVHNEWLAWLNGGPAKGLGRQHRFLRTTQGWVPSTVGRPRRLLDKARKEVEDKYDRELRLLLGGLGDELAPLGRQAEAEEQANEWGRHWGEDEVNVKDITWPLPKGEELTPITVDRLEKAVMTFPAQTGLGWDGVHPRAIKRLPRVLKEELVTIIEVAERTGQWPKYSDEVVVNLLEKPAGGFRPINLFGLVQRVWTRVRKEDARAWEKRNDRPYLYAGVGRSANNAAWLMAARAELATSDGIVYAQVMLDLVKAFEYVPYDKMVEAAVAMGYPIWMLRLSVAAYKATRRVGVLKAMSRSVRPRRGIGAGGGLAIVELKLVVIPIMDRVIMRYARAVLTIYVDDTTVEVMGSKKIVIEDAIGATAAVCMEFAEARMKVSDTKNYVLASRPTVGRSIEAGLKQWGVRWTSTAKVLGVGVGAGAIRCARFIERRLTDFGRTVGRHRRLRRVGIDTARLVKTGGVQRMAYGEEVMGVASGTLHRQRRKAAAAALPGVAGGSVDEVLFAADLGGGRASVDPAVWAHEGPIGAWAEAVWRNLLDRGCLQTLVARAKVRICRAKRMWAVVRGPAAAMVATAARLGWEVKNAFQLCDDTGITISLLEDSPAAVRMHVRQAVTRWRMHRIGGITGAKVDAVEGIEVAGLDAVVRTKRYKWWSQRNVACLKSTIAGRQWPQERLHRAGLASDPGCRLCKKVYDEHDTAALGAAGGGWATSGLDADDIGYKEEEEVVERCRMRSEKPILPACVIGTVTGAERSGDASGTSLSVHEERVARVQPRVAWGKGCIPRGTLIHRHWFCPVVWRRIVARIHAELEGEESQKVVAMLRKIRLEAQLTWMNHWEYGKEVDRALWEKALDQSAVAGVPQPLLESTFHWVSQEGSGGIEGDLYTDASRLDGNSRVGRIGWAFAVVRPGTAEILAAAKGVPPRWINSVPKAEAWALLMAVRVTEFLGATATLDCLSVLQILRAGRRRATHHGKEGARLWNLIFPYFDDVVADDAVRWMPAHKGTHEAGMLRDSRGQPLTEADVEINARVDEWAKSAVEEHRVPQQVRASVAARCKKVQQAAFAIGLATREANGGQAGGDRDASTFTTAKKVGMEGEGGGAGKKPRISCRALLLGGHRLEKTMWGWKCVVCKRESRKWEKIAPEKCPGNRAIKWAQMARRLADTGAGGTDGAGHVRFLSDNMVWCDRCGATATHHAVSLAQPCRGRPRPGGAQHNLRLMRRGINPTTRQAFRDGPHPEPGCCARLSKEDDSERWGSGVEVEHGIAGSKDRRSTHAVGKMATAKERLEELRKRVVARAENKGLGGGVRSGQREEAGSASGIDEAGTRGEGGDGESGDGGDGGNLSKRLRKVVDPSMASAPGGEGGKAQGSTSKTTRRSQEESRGEVGSGCEGEIRNEVESKSKRHRSKHPENRSEEERSVVEGVEGAVHSGQGREGMTSGGLRGRGMARLAMMVSGKCKRCGRCRATAAVCSTHSCTGVTAAPARQRLARLEGRLPMSSGTSLS